MHYYSKNKIAIWTYIFRGGSGGWVLYPVAVCVWMWVLLLPFGRGIEGLCFNCGTQRCGGSEVVVSPVTCDPLTPSGASLGVAWGQRWGHSSSWGRAHHWHCVEGRKGYEGVRQVWLWLGSVATPTQEMRWALVWAEWWKGCEVSYFGPVNAVWF